MAANVTVVTGEAQKEHFTQRVKRIFEGARGKPYLYYPAWEFWTAVLMDHSLPLGTLARQLASEGITCDPRYLDAETEFRPCRGGELVQAYIEMKGLAPDESMTVEAAMKDMQERCCGPWSPHPHISLGISLLLRQPDYIEAGERVIFSGTTVVVGGATFFPTVERNPGGKFHVGLIATDALWDASCRSIWITNSLPCRQR